MDFLPFEIYSAPFPKDKYGHIWEIPNYLTEQELENMQGDNRLNTPVPPDCYPNLAWNMNWQSSKSQYILRYASDIFQWHLDNNDIDASYGFHYDEENSLVPCEFILNERVQASPKGMRLYPPHTDGGKLLTVLVPLRPVKSVPTHFYGKDNPNSKEFPNPTVHIPWKINHGYLFCANRPYSWHGYEGDKYNDRWILNMNLFSPVEGGRKKPFNISNPGGWSRIMSSNKTTIYKDYIKSLVKGSDPDRFN